MLQVTTINFIVKGRGLSVRPKSSHFPAVAMPLQLALALRPLDTKRGLVPQVGLYLPFNQASHSISSSASDAACKRLRAVSLMEHDLYWLFNCVLHQSFWISIVGQGGPPGNSDSALCGLKRSAPWACLEAEFGPLRAHLGQAVAIAADKTMRLP